LFAVPGRSWRGWEGTRNWTSVEGGLEIEARRDGKHNVHVCRLIGGAPPSWTTRVELCIEPGVETSRAARDLADFFSATRRLAMPSWTGQALFKAALNLPPHWPEKRP